MDGLAASLRWYTGWAGDAMRVTVNKLLAGGVLVLVAWVAVVRLAPASVDRQAALDLLAEAIPPVAGRDGSDALWLLDVDVPLGEQARVASSVRRYLDEQDAFRAAGTSGRSFYRKDPRTEWPRFPRADPMGALCMDDDARCLASVRAHLAESAKAVDAGRGGIVSMDRLLGYDGARWGVVPSQTQDMPQHGSFRRALRTSYALQFAQGDRVGALARTCRAIAGWRRIGADTDMLITSMVAAGSVRQDLQLLAEMLSELEPGQHLPANCDAALAATTDGELNLCAAMRSEFRGMDTTVRLHTPSGLNPVPRALYTHLIDFDHLRAVAAPSYAQGCSAPALDAARSDRGFAVTLPTAPRCGWFERVGDPIGCELAEVADGSGLGRYLDRRTDQAAQVALMRTVVWLRGQAVAPGGIAARLRMRPAALGLRREPKLSQDGKSVDIALLSPRGSDTFSLPLPAGL